MDVFSCSTIEESIGAKEVYSAGTIVIESEKINESGTKRLAFPQILAPLYIIHSPSMFAEPDMLIFSGVVFTKSKTVD